MWGWACRAPKDLTWCIATDSSQKFASLFRPSASSRFRLPPALALDAQAVLRPAQTGGEQPEQNLPALSNVPRHDRQSGREPAWRCACCRPLRGAGAGACWRGGSRWPRPCVFERCAERPATVSPPPWPPRRSTTEPGSSRFRYVPGPPARRSPGRCCSPLDVCWGAFGRPVRSVPRDTQDVSSSLTHIMLPRRWQGEVTWSPTTGTQSRCRGASAPPPAPHSSWRWVSALCST